MNKIFMLAFANIRKSKGHTISLGIMLILAAFVLNIGVLLLFNYGTYFEKTSKELNTGDCYITIPTDYVNDDVYSFIENHDNIKEVESELFIVRMVPITKSANEEKKQSMAFFNSDIERNISDKKFVGEYLPLDDNSVYVAYYFNIEWGYKLHDTIAVTFGGEEKEYVIKGFIEDIFFSAPDLGMLSGYLSEDEFNRVLNKSKHTCVAFHAKLYKDTAVVETDVYEYVTQNINTEIKNNNNVSESIFCIHLALCKLARIMMASIVSIMLVALSLIILVICILVIRFRIKNSIEEDMVKIGSLKALGYTSKQIIVSIVLQFLLIAVVGCIIGITLSYMILPAISDILAHQSALKWEPGFDLLNSLCTLFIVLTVVTIIAFLTAQKIKHLNPIIALRGGISTHNFRKNHVSLDKTKLSLNIALGLKYILQNIKQSMMICMITLSVSFVGVFGLLMFYNTVIDTSVFAQTPGSEVANIELRINPLETDNEAFLSEIKERDGVAFAQFNIDAASITIENLTSHCSIMKDYSTRRTQAVYEGRYPIHDNEISINGGQAKLMGTEIGDTVIVKGQSEEKEYLITGLQQGSMFAGMNSALTYEGYLKLYPEFQFNDIFIYLENNVDTVQYLEKLRNEYGDILTGSMDLDKEFEEGMGMYTSIISKVGVAVLGVSFMVIILVLYFVLNSLVIRRRRELGIQKAIGFTTLQLMNQMTFSVMPSILVGIIVGSVLGTWLTNPIMSIAQSGMGIMKAHYIVRLDWIVVFSISFAVLSYITSMLITSKIRKVSAYALVTE